LHGKSAPYEVKIILEGILRIRRGGHVWDGAQNPLGKRTNRMMKKEKNRFAMEDRFAGF